MARKKESEMLRNPPTKQTYGEIDDTFRSRPMDESKAVIGLSWEPMVSPFTSSAGVKAESNNSKLLDFPTTASEISIFNSELIDGIPVPPINKINKLREKQVKCSASRNWFKFLSPTMTPELKQDLQLIKLRSVIDPKRHYKKGDLKRKTLPEFFQVGTVLEPATEFFSGRLTKKERNATLADELLSDKSLAEYREREVREIEERKQPAGVDKWKNRGQLPRKQRRH